MKYLHGGIPYFYQFIYEIIIYFSIFNVLFRFTSLENEQPLLVIVYFTHKHIFLHVMTIFDTYFLSFFHFFHGILPHICAIFYQKYWRTEKFFLI